MRVYFTKHAEEKFDILKKYRVFVSKKRVENIIKTPNVIDHSRHPLLIAQGNLDPTHVLKVVYRKEGDTSIILTFYPGRISHYGKS